MITHGHFIGVKSVQKINLYEENIHSTFGKQVIVEELIERQWTEINKYTNTQYNQANTPSYLAHTWEKSYILVANKRNCTYISTLLYLEIVLWDIVTETDSIV